MSPLPRTNWMVPAADAPGFYVLEAQRAPGGTICKPAGKRPVFQ